MFDSPKRITQVKYFVSNSKANRFEQVNDFLKNERDVEYVDLKADEEHGVLVLVYSLPKK